MSRRTLASRGPAETQAIGERLGARLTPGAVVACTGELGAGKTCFLQGLARGLGVTGGVTSPTFVLVNQYRGGRMPIYHLDAYRTGSLTELVDLGLEEMLHGDGVTVIEWAERGAPLRDWTTVRIQLQSVSEHVRRLTCLKGAERVEECFRSDADPGH